MNKDPFSILGVSQNASEDEIKSAYRKLAKQYHPDVNNGSADSEAKMKEINEAYSEALKIKRSGGTYNPNAQSGHSSYGGYSSQGGSYGQTGYDDPFSGFGFGFGDFGFGSSQRTAYRESSSPELRTARNYINTGHYQEALNVLQKTTDRSAEWFYLSARANIGLSNRTAALTYARQAAQMDPDNYEYAQLLSRLEGNSESYRHHSTTHGGIPLTQCSSPCAWICFLNIFCNCCCRTGYGMYWC